MIDLDKLSYQAYGNLVLITLGIIALLFNLFPFSLIELLICVGQVPIYLYARSRFKEPIHAVGLNKCYALTTLYYILLFITIKGMIALTNVYIGLIFSIIITVTSCYVTSTAPNAKNKIGKLFFGYKKHSESKYEKLIEYIKFNGLDPELINAEVAANSRQVADMNQNFNNQIATLQSFNNLGSQLASCCCENRLGIANLNSTILSENCADRAALADGLKDVLINQTANTQRILDQLCNDKIDAKNEKIADLQREILMKDLQASQVAQTADLRANNAIVANQLVSELRSCPIPAQPVYGNTPIFECNRNGSCGCGSYYNVV